MFPLSGGTYGGGFAVGQLELAVVVVVAYAVAVMLPVMALVKPSEEPYAARFPCD